MFIEALIVVGIFLVLVGETTNDTVRIVGDDD